jgi:hypothetical protein
VEFSEERLGRVVGFVQRRVADNRHRLSVWAMPTRGLVDRHQDSAITSCACGTRKITWVVRATLPVYEAGRHRRGSCLRKLRRIPNFFWKAHFLPSRSSQPEASGLRRNERRVTQATGHGVCVGIADKRSWSPLSDFSDGILHLGHPESSGCPPAASRSGWHDNAFLLRRRRCTPQPGVAQRRSGRAHPGWVSAAAGLPQRSFTWGRLQTHWGCATPSA